MITRRLLALLAKLNWGELTTDGLCLAGISVLEVGIYQLWGEGMVWLTTGGALVAIGCLRLWATARGQNGRPG